jgi:hypothetical protein
VLSHCGFAGTALNRKKELGRKMRWLSPSPVDPFWGVFHNDFFGGQYLGLNSAPHAY